MTDSISYACTWDSDNTARYKSEGTGHTGSLLVEHTEPGVTYSSSEAVSNKPGFYKLVSWKKLLSYLLKPNIWCNGHYTSL